MASCWIDYLGIVNPRRCVFTDVLGLWPGTFMLDFSPQPSLPAIIGDLSLSDGNGGAITIRNCKVDTASVVRTTDGDVEHIQGLDPRWTWAFGEIHGVYNLRNPDGTIDEDSERTPQELATMLFQAMGVSDADVSAMPNTTRPYVNWRAATPRPHLQKLLDELGCTVAIDWSAFRPVVCRWGEGVALPVGFEQSNTFGLDLSESPRSLKLRCARNIYETKFLLEMVLPETDSQWVRWDEVSYMPEGGWVIADASDPLPDADEPEASLAKRWFGRVYRIRANADGELFIPGYGEIVDIGQCLPLRPVRATSYDDIDGRKVAVEPAIEGSYWLGDVNDDEIDPADNCDDFTPYSGDFSLRHDEGLVVFGQRVLRIDRTGSDPIFEPAELWLTVSHHVFDIETGQYESKSLERQISDAPTGPLVEELDDTGLQYIGVYEDDVLTEVTDNENALVASLNLLLDALQAEYLPSASVAKRYMGIGYIQLDGLRRQATYRVHYQEGANTWAYLNTEAEIGAARMREVRRVADLQRGRRVRRLRRDEGATV